MNRKEGAAEQERLWRWAGELSCPTVLERTGEELGHRWSAVGQDSLLTLHLLSCQRPMGKQTAPASCQSCNLYSQKLFIQNKQTHGIPAIYCLTAGKVWHRNEQPLGPCQILLQLYIRKNSIEDHSASLKWLMLHWINSGVTEISISTSGSKAYCSLYTQGHVLQSPL